jgi:hypothetical protein
MKNFYFILTLFFLAIFSQASASEIGCPTAGVGGSTTICETSTTSIVLFDLITGGSSGGTWIRTAGTGGIFDAVAGTFTSGFGSTTSSFVYTIQGSGICPDETSVVTVNINRQPNAGFDGCFSVQDTNPTIIDLYSLITGEDPQGVWTRTTGVGGTFSAAAGIYSAAVGATTSTFVYTTVGVAPCINDSSIANVIINGPPMGQAVDLFCEAFGTLFPNDVVFDWNNVGQTSFNYYYSIDGSMVSGNTLVSNFVVPNVPSESSVYFNVQPIGNTCFPSTFTICNMLANTVFESDVVAFYPNPFHDNLNLKFAVPVKSLQITNVLGQQVFSRDYNEKDFQINLAHLIGGTYFVRVQTASAIKTFKIVKN